MIIESQPFSFSFSFSFCIWRSAIFIFVVLCHVFLLLFSFRAVLIENTSVSQSLVSMLLVTPVPPKKLLVAVSSDVKKNDNKRSPHQVKDKSREQKDMSEKDKVEIASNVAEPVPSSEIDLGTRKSLATLDSLGQRYGLTIPKGVVEEVLTPAQQAAQDPRTNSPKLTKSEQFAMAAGTLDCIFQGRLANGKTVREPGRWAITYARAAGSLRPIVEVRFCVRLSQADDGDGNDLTEISSGIKGKF